MANKFTSPWLFENSDKHSDDVLFFTGVVSQKKNTVIVDMTDCPVAVNTQKDADKILSEHHIQLPLKSDIRFKMEEALKLGKINKKLSMISGGAFLWVKEEGKPKRLAVLLRNDPNAGNGQWTDPNGLCAENPNDTPSKELAEECPFVFVPKMQNKIVVPILTDYSPTVTYCLPLTSKTAQTKDILNEMKKNYPGVLDINRAIMPDISFEYMAVERQDVAPEHAKTILFVNEGKIIAEKEQVLVFHEPEFNTWAFRDVYEMTVPSDMMIVPLDPEGFGRKAALMTADELRGQPMLSSLKAYTDILTPR